MGDFQQGRGGRYFDYTWGAGYLKLSFGNGFIVAIDQDEFNRKTGDAFIGEIEPDLLVLSPL